MVHINGDVPRHLVANIKYARDKCFTQTCSVILWFYFSIVGHEFWLRNHLQNKTLVTIWNTNIWFHLNPNSFVLCFFFFFLFLINIYTLTNEKKPKEQKTNIDHENKTAKNNFTTTIEILNSAIYLSVLCIKSKYSQLHIT